MKRSGAPVVTSFMGTIRGRRRESYEGARKAGAAGRVIRFRVRYVADNLMLGSRALWRRRYRKSAVFSMPREMGR